MAYEVQIRPRARKQLSELPTPQARLMLAHLDGLAVNPFPPDSKKLRGNHGYSIRVGDYRALYTVDTAVRIVAIYRIGHRREVYRS